MPTPVNIQITPQLHQQIIASLSTLRTSAIPNASKSMSKSCLWLGLRLWSSYQLPAAINPLFLSPHAIRALGRSSWLVGLHTNLANISYYSLPLTNPHPRTVHPYQTLGPSIRATCVRQGDSYSTSASYLWGIVLAITQY